jgi:hypothetical protein
MDRLTEALTQLQRPDETEDEWTERTGGREALEALDPFASFRGEDR